MEIGGSCTREVYRVPVGRLWELGPSWVILVRFRTPAISFFDTAIVLQVVSWPAPSRHEIARRTTQRPGSRANLRLASLGKCGRLVGLHLDKAHSRRGDHSLKLGMHVQLFDQMPDMPFGRVPGDAETIRHCDGVQALGQER
jgi:hypothetical protein